MLQRPHLNFFHWKSERTAQFIHCIPLLKGDKLPFPEDITKIPLQFASQCHCKIISFQGKVTCQKFKVYFSCIPPCWLRLCISLSLRSSSAAFLSSSSWRFSSSAWAKACSWTKQISPDIDKKYEHGINIPSLFTIIKHLHLQRLNQYSTNSHITNYLKAVLILIWKAILTYKTHYSRGIFK